MRNTKLQGQLGYASVTIEDASLYIAQLERKLKSAHEFMTSAWEPTDIERHRFVEEVAELIQLERDSRE